MTRTTPFLRTMMHLLQIFLPAALTFTSDLVPRPFETKPLEPTQNLRPVRGNSNGVLEMSGETTILGNSRPTVVQDLYLLLSCIDHGLDS